jgi:predicted DNA-binding protein with PD1-like motif
MRHGITAIGLLVAIGLALCRPSSVSSDGQPDMIPASRPIPVGLAPGMQVKLLKTSSEEQVYAVIFQKGDEVLSGLTDFAIKYKIQAAHLTGIGAASGATVGWLDLNRKEYRAIPVKEQVEVLSMVGDIATFEGKPVVHAHLALGRQDGSLVGGHLWEMHVNPTLEVFVTAFTTPLKKRLDEPSGMKVIDPAK